ncbi:unnamed protein product [Linum trigynum]|uniref:RNase H type-1 domain-containing protein n=1 Tax=Linum trigynum TaxID=586398 RepID=A0AAV2E3F7_9ROSI
MATETISEEDLQRPVSEFVDEDGNWKVEKFASLLPQEIQHKITAHAVDPLATEEDHLFWTPTTDGRFTTKSAYQILHAALASAQQSWWKAIWHLTVPERVRCFIWLLAQGKVSSNEVRAHRRLTQEDSCYRCPSQTESLPHIFRSCPPAAFFWHRVVPSAAQQEFFSLPWEEWLRRNLTSKESSSTGLPWDAFFGISLWCLWKNRNEGVFKGINKTLSAPSLMQSIKIKAGIWIRAWNAPTLLGGRGNLAPNRVLTDIGWQPPPAGWTKVNVDGAAGGSQGLAGAGGVIRDSNSCWQGGFVSNLGSCSATLAELWAIYHGLRLVWNKGYKTIIIESDSQLAIQLVKNRSDPLHPYAALLSTIRRKISLDWVVNLVHTYRKGNRVADWLSKYSLVYPYDMYELEKPPQEALHILQDDQRGITFPRNIVIPSPTSSISEELLFL